MRLRETVFARAHDFFVHPQQPTEVMQALLSEAQQPEQVDSAWSPDLRPEDIRNAHTTNNPQEMLAALKGPYNYLEGDVRTVGDLGRFPGASHRTVITSHSDTDTGGFTLSEWLSIALASGKGIKLDIKTGSAVPEIIRCLQGIPSERLTLNADVIRGPGCPSPILMKLWHAALDHNCTLDRMKAMRAAFPQATIALGAWTLPQPEGTAYTPAQCAELSRWADEIGGPVAFALRAELVTSDVVKQLAPHGHVSLWNDPKTYQPGDVAAATRHYRDMGVKGAIDLRNN